MGNIKGAMQLGGAFVGVIVGAGFASGQEIMQFFTSFGVAGLLGAVVASALFVFLATVLSGLGQQLGGDSHKRAIHAIGGPYLGWLIDAMITFFMFAIVVVMFSGGGSLLEQISGLPKLWGSIATMIATVLIVCLDVRQVIAVVGVLTVPLLLAVVVVGLWAIFSADADMQALEQAAQAQSKGADHWLVAALLYVSYNIVAGAPFLTILGSRSVDRSTALLGGALGGLLLGLLIVVIGAAMFMQGDSLGGVAMPMLALASQISPTVGVLMGTVVFAMILNTAVGMLYAFVARILPADTLRFRAGAAIAGVLAYAFSFIGFIKLVGTVYPFFGYLGFVLMACTLVAWVRRR